MHIKVPVLPTWKCPIEDLRLGIARLYKSNSMLAGDKVQLDSTLTS